MAKSVSYGLSLHIKGQIVNFKKSIPFFILGQLIFFFFPILGFAQENQQEKYLSLKEAIQFAKNQNTSIQAANIEEEAVDEERRTLNKAALPSVFAGSSYQRFSNLTLFTDGLKHADSGTRKPSPNSANAGIEVLFNIYSGGHLRSLQKEQNSRLKLAKLNTLDTSGDIAFQTASQYLELVKLNELQQFILDQLKRARVRLENINSLYKNHKVTKSDVLRAQVTLSNVELSLQQNQNDIAIANQKLAILTDLPDAIKIIPIDSAGIEKPEIESLSSLVEKTETSSFSVQKAGENIELQRTKVKTAQSDNMPTLSFNGAYGIHYPNYLFFPPVDQAYSVGFVCLKAQYEISSIYKNKEKLTAAKMRVNEAELIQKEKINKVRSEIKAYYIKYDEALYRISVNQKSVEQTKVNYKIVNTKYLNQLSLLTDLLDADNLYQESRQNLVKAQTDALMIYYRILYTSGNL